MAPIHDLGGPWDGRIVACLSAAGHTTPLRRVPAAGEEGGATGGPLAFACPLALQRSPAVVMTGVPEAGFVAIMAGYCLVDHTAAVAGLRGRPSPIEWMAAEGCLWDCTAAALELRRIGGPEVAWAADVLAAVCPARAPDGSASLRVIQPVAIRCESTGLGDAVELGRREWPRPRLLTAVGASPAALVVVTPSGLAWARARGQAGCDRLAHFCAAPEAGRRGP